MTCFTVFARKWTQCLHVSSRGSCTRSRARGAQPSHHYLFLCRHYFDAHKQTHTCDRWACLWDSTPQESAAVYSKGLSRACHLSAYSFNCNTRHCSFSSDLSVASGAGRDRGAEPFSISSTTWLVHESHECCLLVLCSSGETFCGVTVSVKHNVADILRLTQKTERPK